MTIDPLKKDCRWQHSAFSIQHSALHFRRGKTMHSSSVYHVVCLELIICITFGKQLKTIKPGLTTDTQIQLVNASFLFAWPSPLDKMHACFLNKHTRMPGTIGRELWDLLEFLWALTSHQDILVVVTDRLPAQPCQSPLGSRNNSILVCTHHIAYWTLVFNIFQYIVATALWSELASFDSAWLGHLFPVLRKFQSKN